MLFAIFSATTPVASAQSTPYRRATEASQSAPSDQPGEFKDASSPSALTPLKSQTLEAPYDPMTPRQSLRWFITNTIGPSHLAGGIFLAATGTALDRPKEYGPHGGGFADRYGMRKTGIVTGNAIEASAGLLSVKIRAIFACRDGPSRLATEMLYGLRSLLGATMGTSGLRMLAIWRFSGVAFSPTLGAFKVKPIRTTRSCARRKGAPDAWRPMLSRDFGPLSRCMSFRNATNTFSYSEVPPQRACAAPAPYYF